jgi:hypothetical protein
MEDGKTYNSLQLSYNEIESFFKTADTDTINENLLDMLCIQAWESLATKTATRGDKEKLASLYLHFKSAKETAHMRAFLLPLFRLLDPITQTQWPNSFLVYLSSKMKNPKKKKIRRLGRKLLLILL